MKYIIAKQLVTWPSTFSSQFFSTGRCSETAKETLEFSRFRNNNLSFEFLQFTKKAIMSIVRSTGLLFFSVFLFILFSAEGAGNCEIELIHGCISKYKGILRAKPNPEDHCSRVQVNQVILQIACCKLFVFL